MNATADVGNSDLTTRFDFSGVYSSPAPNNVSEGTGVCSYCANTYVRLQGSLESPTFSVNNISYTALLNNPSFTASLNIPTTLSAQVSVPITINAFAANVNPPPSPTPPTSPPPNSPPEISEQAMNALLTFTEEVKGGSEAISNLIAEWNTTGAWTKFVNFLTTEVEPSFSGAISRFGGAIFQVEQAALDTNAAKLIVGLLQNPNNPAAVVDASEQPGLTRALNDADCAAGIQTACPAGTPTAPPTKPTSQNGNTENFNTPVFKKEVQTLDPALAHGYEYKTGQGNPNFYSVVLPSVGSGETYEIEVLEDGTWVVQSTIKPFQEYVFTETGGVADFRVVGINYATGDTSDWLTGLSFVDDGEFTGSIMALDNTTTPTETPEPSMLGYFGTFLLVLCLGFRKASLRQ